MKWEREEGGEREKMKGKGKKMEGERLEVAIEGDQRGRKGVTKEKRGGEGGRGPCSRTTIHLY